MERRVWIIRVCWLITVMICLVGKVSAQGGAKAIRTTDIALVQSEEQVRVSFKLHAGKKATKNDYNLVVVPVIKHGTREQTLPTIVVRGNRSKVSEQRHARAVRQRSYDERPFYTENGQTVEYGATILYEKWMQGAQLIFRGVTVGCCSSTETEIGVVAENLLWAEPVEVVEVVEVAVPVAVESTGDRLAQRFGFICPLSELDQLQEQTPFGRRIDYQMSLNEVKGGYVSSTVNYLVEETRQNALSIFFRQAQSVIDRNFAQNNAALVELISSVRELLEAEDCTVARIVIVGFASPEGSLERNNRLAWERASAIQNFLTANSNLSPDRVDLFNGSVDWGGLRQLVAQSNMESKYQILNIIDDIPVWEHTPGEGRLSRLKRLEGGVPYQYMLQTFFPQLRQAAYIKLYYENR